MARKRSLSPEQEKKTPKNKAGSSGAGKHSDNERDKIGVRVAKSSSKLDVQELLQKTSYPLRAYKNTPKRNKELDTTKADVMKRNTKGELALSSQEFEQKVGQQVRQNLDKMRSDGVITGSVMRLPKRGKLFVVGDVHLHVDHLLAAVKKADLENNPTHKILLLGDVLGGSKAMFATKKNEELLSGDPAYRVLTWLMARYPDQIVMVKGNHEMGVIASEKKHKREEKQADALRSGDAETAVLDDPAIVAETLTKLPTVIQIGDKSKGELSRTFQHGTGVEENHADLQVADDADTPEKVTSNLYRFYGGDMDLSEEAMKKANAASKTDKSYFGHVPVHVVKGWIADGLIVPARREGNVMELPGNATYVDSQTPDSGIVEIDLEDDSKQDVFHSFSSLLPELGGKDIEDFGANPATDKVTPSPEKLKRLMEAMLRRYS